MSSTKITIPLSTVPKSVPFTLSSQQNVKENKGPQLGWNHILESNSSTPKWHKAHLSTQTLGNPPLKVLNMIRDCRAGHAVGNWIAQSLLPTEYKQLEEYLDGHEELSDFYRNYLLSDYDPESSLHVIRMPSSVHEIMISLVQASIERQLDKFRASDIAELALYTNKILNGGSTDIRLKDGSRHQPDLQFVTELSRFPGLIIEVAYSQSVKENGKSLSPLAEKYVLQSSGNIKLVIGVTIKYDPDQEHPLSFKGDISLWKSSIVQDSGRLFLERQTIINEEEFRSKDGLVRNAERKITIPLTTWALNELEVPPIVKEHAISLSYPELAGWLHRAEKKYNRAELQTDMFNDLATGVCERRLEITPPPETLSPFDEDQFAALEKNDEKKALEGIRDGNSASKDLQDEPQIDGRSRREDGKQREEGAEKDAYKAIAQEKIYRMNVNRWQEQEGCHGLLWLAVLTSPVIMCLATVFS